MLTLRRLAGTSSVLDDNHGIAELPSLDDESKQVFVPWYIRGSRSHYYTRNHGWQRAEYDTEIEAYNHIARSRGMHRMEVV